MMSQFFDMASLWIFFWCCFAPLVEFNYWSKFHVNIITGSGVMTISFYERLTRNPEIGNTPVWVLPNIWTLRRVRNTKFDKNVSYKMLLNAAEGQGCSFSLFWVKLLPTKIRVKIHFLDCWAILKCILKAIILVFFFELRTLWATLYLSLLFWIKNSFIKGSKKLRSIFVQLFRDIFKTLSVIQNRALCNG